MVNTYHGLETLILMLSDGMGFAYEIPPIFFAIKGFGLLKLLGFFAGFLVWGVCVQRITII